jgi:hypothetical protein
VARFLQAAESEPPRHVTTVGRLKGVPFQSLPVVCVFEIPAGDFARDAQPRARLYAAAKALRECSLIFILSLLRSGASHDDTASSASSRLRARGWFTPNIVRGRARVKPDAARFCVGV